MDRQAALPIGRTFDLAAHWRARAAKLAYGLLLSLLLGFVYSGGHDDQRVIELLFLWVGACVTAYRSAVGAHLALLDRRLAWALAGFFVWGVLSTSFALSPRHAWYETTSLFLLLFIALEMGRDIARGPSSLTSLLKAFGAIACAYAFKIISVYVAVWLVNARPETVDFTPGFTNFRHFNHVQTVALPLLGLVYLLSSDGPRLRPLWMGTAVVWWAIMFVTGGRGTMLGLAAGGVVVLALRGRAALPLLRVLSIAALLGGIVYGVFFWLLPHAMGLPPFGEGAYVVGRTLEDPVNGRRLLWECAFDLIHRHPWLGVGPLHFAHYGLSRGDAAHPHNWMLQIAAEWGIPALAMVCIALALSARGLWLAGRRLDRNDSFNQNMLAAWMLTGAAILVDGMVSGNIVMPQSQMAITFYIACATGWTASFSQHPTGCKNTRVVSGIFRTLILAVAVISAFSVGPEFVDKAINGTVSASSPAGHLGYWWTRLWMDTYF